MRTFYQQEAFVKKHISENDGKYMMPEARMQLSYSHEQRQENFNKLTLDFASGEWEKEYYANSVVFLRKARAALLGSYLNLIMDDCYNKKVHPYRFLSFVSQYFIDRVDLIDEKCARAIDKGIYELDEYLSARHKNEGRE